MLWLFYINYITIKLCCCCCFLMKKNCNRNTSNRIKGLIQQPKKIIFYLHLTYERHQKLSIQLCFFFLSNCHLNDSYVLSFAYTHRKQTLILPSKHLYYIFADKLQNRTTIQAVHLTKKFNNKLTR